MVPAIRIEQVTKAYGELQALAGINLEIQQGEFFGLLPPLSQREFFLAYPLRALTFALFGSGIMAALGIIAGIHSDKVDQLSAFQNFIILPLTFLSGVFYSIHSLPPFWQGLSHFNPIFFMIDGFRYGFFGHSDVSPWMSLAFVAVCFFALSLLTLWLIKTGYKLRH